jgi:hypothetical protein
MIPQADLNKYARSVRPFIPTSEPAHDRQYHADGFVIVPGLIQDTDLEPLRVAADEVVEKAHQREWKQVRVVGKQFPPWDEHDDIWGVQNIMHPALKQDIFREWYGRRDMLQVSAALMGCEMKDMQFGE